MKVDACWALSYLAEGGEMLIQVRMLTLRSVRMGGGGGGGGRYMYGALQQLTNNLVGMAILDVVPVSILRN